MIYQNLKFGGLKDFHIVIFNKGDWMMLTNVIYNTDFREGFTTLDLSEIKLFVTDPSL
jgi:hypothetical protein